MSYKIGQFKRTDLNIENYQAGVNIPIRFGEIEAEDGRGKYYGFSLQGNNTSFQAGDIYVLKYALYKNGEDSENLTRVKLKLFKDTLANNYQALKAINLTQYQKDEHFFDEVAFVPQFNDYDFLVAESDLSTIVEPNVFTKAAIKFDTETTTLHTLTNLLNKEPFKNKNIKQIGIQGPEGLLFVINGEPIRLGKSGIYLSQEDMLIQSLAVQVVEEKDFILPTSNNEKRYQFFTIDYIYEEEGEV